MGVLSYVLGAVLILVSIILILVVLLQESKSAGLSGAIGGGADSFLGKTKGHSIGAKLAKLTKVCAVIFFVLAVVIHGILLFTK